MRTKFPNQKMKKEALLANNGAVVAGMQNLANAITSRAQLQSKLGLSFEGNRELYDALGYPKTLTFSHYASRYTRQDIAQRVVNAYPDATWRGRPKIKDDEEQEDTSFETEWEQLERDLRVYHYFNRLDRLSGIGAYSVLLIGFDDGKSLDQPVNRATEVLYIQPFAENHAVIDTIVDDTSDPRFGKPDTYRITISQENSSTSGTTGLVSTGATSREIVVHHSRVIHVASDPLESDIFGTPVLEAIYNRLQDLELVTGGSSEMFWRGAFPGYAFNLDPEGEPVDTDAMEDEIEKFVHKLNRYMKLQGMDVQELSPQVASPKDNFEVLIALIAGAKGIPQRILLGSERGELASSQDKDNWDARVDERRKDFAEPIILRPFIDKLVEVGVLTAPKDDDYIIEWPDIDALSEKEQAEIAKTKAEAIAKYAGTAGADMVIPIFNFLTDILGMDEDKAQAIADDVVAAMEQEEEDARIAAEEEAAMQQEEEQEEDEDDNEE